MAYEAHYLFQNPKYLRSRLILCTRIKAGTTTLLDNYKQYLKNAYNKKIVTEKQLDENIKGNLRVMIRLGLLDYFDKNPYSKIGINGTIDP